MEAASKSKVKEFTLDDDHGPKKLIVRDKVATYILDSYTSSLESATRIFGKASFLLQTRDMEFVIAASEKTLAVWSSSAGKVVFEQHYNYIYSLTLSENEQFVQVLDKVDSNEGTTLIYRLEGMAKVREFRENAHSNYYNKASYPLVRFSSDDSTAFRYNSKVVEVYDRNWERVREIPSGPVEFFEVSKVSVEGSYLVACLFLDKKNNSGQVTLFESGSDAPYYEKTIKKAEEIKVKFSPTSNKFLMELQTYYDPTGKSYYGEYGLYIFNDQTRKINRVTTCKGPLHDFSWDAQGEHFVVISGFMPATSVMFSAANKEVFTFGTHHRNSILWGNQGRLLCLAGFGNLNGEMEVWDLKTKEKIGYCKSNSASHCQWSPDDRKILTSILTPRLRVDNCYKVFAYTGTLLHKVDFDDTELYETVFANTTHYQKAEPRGLSPNRKVELEVKKTEEKFKSFGASLGFTPVNVNTVHNPPARKTDEPKLAPGQHPEDLPKKKKRVRNRKEPNLEAQ